MPFVQIDVTKDGVTREQKAQLISGVTKLLLDVLQKDPDLTHVIIREVETDNWGLSGIQVTEKRKQSKA
ncbi:4-oxalocrotonate tautomerase family protein [Pseudoflavitalea sp. G-6-1-2]|uniref:tautomerase family protein n=1 Tax=Pseudoflavitalea sp. G-6-1-2 TaxID=2728841 RepID=UPI00146D1A9E|nr:4-oxalocrotonate tautomerase family protein [Pseudoflavitalea sp. G-6-1-2]NML21419.1 4-oxalocrotonate tautomerase family protein [Pseudoflavitalea sp. G-6-1-2]